MKTNGGPARLPIPPRHVVGALVPPRYYFRRLRKRRHLQSLIERGRHRFGTRPPSEEEARNPQPGGLRSVIAESILIKHQLLIRQSLPPPCAQSPRLGSADRRFLF